MSIILEFGGKKVKITKTTVSPYVVDLCDMSTIHIYCDVVHPQIVGDTNAKLLRSIQVEGKSGNVITKTFANIQYAPVQTKSLEDVEILLRNDTGELVPFERGKVAITLHFRQHSYFSKWIIRTFVTILINNKGVECLFSETVHSRQVMGKWILC